MELQGHGYFSIEVESAKGKHSPSQLLKCLLWPPPPTLSVTLIILRANQDLDVEFPLYVGPNDIGLPADADAAAFAGKKEEVRSLLLKHGAVVFRG